ITLGCFFGGFFGIFLGGSPNPPRCHEPELRRWARELGAPVLSVDYALAPEAPFPRALEECFYAYCWALCNCKMLGWTGERVCLAGDSAGGNLCLGVSLLPPETP
ncbi:hormone-sensitive lipase-like, partial [Cyanistes caeruleus]|uniref:hormone-sensitive lipase-like n=1 Tax=Cyanistes caeruleus TaxID=156563 RepID=UPI000CDAB89A